jgi:rubredoxin
MDIIAKAFELEAAVKKLGRKIRLFFYQVVLSGLGCPECGGSLTMIVDGLCNCKKCGYEFDPTLEFQKCTHCGGKARLKVSRYFCTSCKQEIVSKFLFDSRVYDREYFVQKMAASRQQKKKRCEELRRKVMQYRSGSIQTEPAEFAGMADLLAAIDNLTKGIKPNIPLPAEDGFDLNRYQRHIQAHIDEFETNLRDIPQVIENARKDLIWRFIAVIFLAHAAVVKIEQDGLDIMVTKNETYGKGQDFFNEIEKPYGFEGFAG